MTFVSRLWGFACANVVNMLFAQAIVAIVVTPVDVSSLDRLSANEDWRPECLPIWAASLTKNTAPIPSWRSNHAWPGFAFTAAKE